MQSLKFLHAGNWGCAVGGQGVGRPMSCIPLLMWEHHLFPNNWCGFVSLIKAVKWGALGSMIDLVLKKGKAKENPFQLKEECKNWKVSIKSLMVSLLSCTFRAYSWWKSGPGMDYKGIWAIKGIGA